jgi:hypothetical protein
MGRIETLNVLLQIVAIAMRANFNGAIKREAVLKLTASTQTIAQLLFSLATAKA